MRKSKEYRRGYDLGLFDKQKGSDFNGFGFEGDYREGYKKGYLDGRRSK